MKNEKLKNLKNHDLDIQTSYPKVYLQIIIGKPDWLIIGKPDWLKITF